MTAPTNIRFTPPADNEERIERLSQLLRILDLIEADQFDGPGYKFNMTHYVEISPDDSIEVEDLDTEDLYNPNAIPHFCETSCCLWGSAGLDPWFRNQGIFIDFAAQDVIGWDGEGEDYVNAQLAEHFFDISMEEGESMFSGHHPDDPSYVRKWVEEVISAYKNGEGDCQ